MDDKPPRRTRRSPQKRSQSSSLPLIPVLIGVVVLGFVIGAGLSFGRHLGSPRNVAAVSPSFAPVAVPSVTSPETPVPFVTPMPKRAASDVAPSAIATLGVSPAPSVRESPSPKSAATAAQQAASQTQDDAPVAGPGDAGRPAATALAPRVVAIASAAPTRLAISPSPETTEAAAVQSPTPIAVPSDSADSDFGRLCASVVRQYLRALARGDTESAYGAFGAAPGSPDVTFPERQYLDPSAQIGPIVAHGSNDLQTVSATIVTASGNYVADYTLRRTPTGAAVIVSHTITKS